MNPRNRTKRRKRLRCTQMVIRLEVHSKSHTYFLSWLSNTNGSLNTQSFVCSKTIINQSPTTFIPKSLRGLRLFFHPTTLTSSQRPHHDLTTTPRHFQDPHDPWATSRCINPDDNYGFYDRAILVIGIITRFSSNLSKYICFQHDYNVYQPRSESLLKRQPTWRDWPAPKSVSCHCKAPDQSRSSVGKRL